MTRQVRVSTRAADDADQIFLWIAERSWDGARRWYDKYLQTLKLLPEHARLHQKQPNWNWKFDNRSSVRGKEINTVPCF